MSISKLFNRMLPACMILLIFLIFTAMSISLLQTAWMHPSISITAATNITSYHLRQNVNVSGNFMEDGSPVTDALLSIDVRNPRGDSFLFRTIPIGNPTEEWVATINEAYVRNSTGSPIDKAEVDSVVQLFVTVRSNVMNEISGYITATVYDGNLIPIRAAWSPISLSSISQVSLFWSCYIPEWAYCGKATVHYNFYRDLPKNNGEAYIPEKTIQFYITRNLELGAPQRPPKSSYTTLPGQYNTTFQVPPDRYTLPGNYTVHVTGRVSPILVTYATTTFNVQTHQCPPQAAFTYSPLEVYQNMTVTFDASSSSAEGYNDTITQYEWTINDPYNPEHIIKTSPTTTHTFEYGGTFIVELNVTDNEGLWSTTSKPITILPEFGPTANFTWSPITPRKNRTVTFDASSSEEGWSASTQQFSPITTYVWNFSDDTGNHTIPTNPVIDQLFHEPGNYTVTLTVYDAVNRADTIFYIVEVQNASRYDINGDGIINVMDIFAVAKAFGSEPGDPNWDPRCDVNDDLIVNVMDIFAVAKHFGEEA